MSAATSPALSVILVATHDYALIRSAVRNLTRQRDVAVELVIAAPQALVASITEEDRARMLRCACAWGEALMLLKHHVEYDVGYVPRDDEPPR